MVARRLFQGFLALFGVIAIGIALAHFVVGPEAIIGGSAPGQTTAVSDAFTVVLGMRRRPSCVLQRLAALRRLDRHAGPRVIPPAAAGLGARRRTRPAPRGGRLARQFPAPGPVRAAC